jgi:hypothetical protein
MMISTSRQHQGKEKQVKLKLNRSIGQHLCAEENAQLPFVSCNLNRRSPLGNLCWAARATTGYGAPDH